MRKFQSSCFFLYEGSELGNGNTIIVLCMYLLACRDIDGRTFSEGEQWHPSYPLHGLVSCINCTCVVS